MTESVKGAHFLKDSGLYADILRDDLVFPDCPGNKWRKLKPFRKLLSEGKVQKVITCGGAFSNHLAAFASLIREFKVEGEAWVRGEEDPDNPTLKKLSLSGVQLKFFSRNDYRLLREKPAGVKSGVLFIPEGGAAEEAVISCSEITSEQPGYDYYLVASGTGTTTAGMAAGLKSDIAQVISVPVVNDASVPAKVEESLKRLDHSGRFRQIRFMEGFSCGGYAKTNEELVEFINRFYRETGIPSDLIYTGKMFLAFKKLIGDGYFRGGSRILLIHTGGLQGNAGMAYMGKAGRLNSELI